MKRYLVCEDHQIFFNAIFDCLMIVSGVPPNHKLKKTKQIVAGKPVEVSLISDPSLEESIEVTYAQSTASAVSLLEERSFTAVICDLTLSDGTAYPVIVEAKQMGIRVAVISGATGYETLKAAISKGASTIIPKGINPDVMVHAIAYFINGGDFVPVALIESEPDYVSRLTLEQRELMAMACKGTKNKQIADILKISIDAVAKNFEQIYDVLNVKNQREAVAMFMRSILSADQTELLRLSATGLKDREVAERVGKNENTVRSSFARITARLQVNSKQEAISLAVLYGLIPTLEDQTE